jgi:hypothetical protein
MNNERKDDAEYQGSTKEGNHLSGVGRLHTESNTTKETH